jgi:hypothetical protein
MTKRTAITIIREELKEVNADSTYSNYFLYNELLKHAKWLIKREVGAGRIYSNDSIFQTLNCINVIETSTIDPCCPVKTNCRIFRTEEKLPDMWMDNNGPIIRNVRSVDNMTDFTMTNPTTWQRKHNDPYQIEGKIKYAFYSDGYLWFPEYNPHKVRIFAFFQDDTVNMDYCSQQTKDCLRFLDTRFMIPDWLEGEMYAKALESLAGITKKMPEDLDIDKNSNRKN